MKCQAEPSTPAGRLRIRCHTSVARRVNVEVRVVRYVRVRAPYAALSAYRRPHTLPPPRLASLRPLRPLLFWYYGPRQTWSPQHVGNDEHVNKAVEISRNVLESPLLRCVHVLATNARGVHVCSRVV